MLPLPEYQAGGLMFRFRAGSDVGAIQTPEIPNSPSSIPEALAMGVQALFPELTRWQVRENPSWLDFGIDSRVAFYVSGGRQEKP
jgi:hypothetical protein